MYYFAAFVATAYTFLLKKEVTGGFATAENATETFGTSQCTRKLCNDRGKCLGTVDTFACMCDNGYTGSHCDDRLCDSESECSGNGLCVGTAKSPKCVCNQYYGGRRCEHPRKFQLVKTSKKSSTFIEFLLPCSPFDCNFHGLCLGTVANHYCLCQLGYSGPKCENDIFGFLKPFKSLALCRPSDCNFNGLCLGTKGFHICLCHIGYSGQHCERPPYPLCDATDCSNNGLCIGNKNAFTCLCHLGYSGKRCDQSTALVAMCGKSDCNNNGICMGLKSAPICLCNLGYIGQRCERKVGGLGKLKDDPCKSVDCGPNGVCSIRRRGGVCVCNYGYRGDRCQTADGTQSIVDINAE